MPIRRRNIKADRQRWQREASGKHLRPGAQWKKELRQRAGYNKYLLSPEWKAFKGWIVAKRGAKCERCGATDGRLELHHKTYVRFTCELPQDVELLCETCHKKHHRRHKRKSGR